MGFFIGKGEVMPRTSFRSLHGPIFLFFLRVATCSPPSRPDSFTFLPPAFAATDRDFIVWSFGRFVIPSLIFGFPNAAHPAIATRKPSVLEKNRRFPTFEVQQIVINRNGMRRNLRSASDQTTIQELGDPLFAKAIGQFGLFPGFPPRH